MMIYRSPLGNKYIPIFANFCCQNVTNFVYLNKKLMNNKNYLITEIFSGPCNFVIKLLKTLKDDIIVTSYRFVDDNFYLILKKDL